MSSDDDGDVVVTQALALTAWGLAIARSTKRWAEVADLPRHPSDAAFGDLEERQCPCSG